MLGASSVLPSRKMKSIDVWPMSVLF